MVVRGEMESGWVILRGWAKGEGVLVGGESEREGRVARWREMKRRRAGVSMRRIRGVLGEVVGWM